MSVASKTMLRQAPLLSRVFQLNATRQTLAPFSTSARWLAEAETKSEPESSAKPFDSIPVHLGPISKTVMVLGGLYSRYGDVPDTLPNRVYQKTKDKFRARCVVVSMFFTAGLAYVAMTRGKSAQKEGKRYTDDIYDMHHGVSKLHDQLNEARDRRKRYSFYAAKEEEEK